MAGSEINGQVYCSLCDGRNVGEDYTYCDANSKLPDNCLSGNVRGKGCLLCKPGFHPQSYTRECVKNDIPGCGIYDPQENCIECDTFNGYYAIDSVYRNGQVFQTVCNFHSETLKIFLFGLLTLAVT